MLKPPRSEAQARALDGSRAAPPCPAPWRYTSGWAVWHSQHEKVRGMETAHPSSPLFIAVVDDNPADVSIIARVLHTHGLQYTLQVLESRQRALHFFDQLAGEDIRCPDLLLLDDTLPGLDTRELLQWIRAVPACRH